MNEGSYISEPVEEHLEHVIRLEGDGVKSSTDRRKIPILASGTVKLSYVLLVINWFKYPDHPGLISPVGPVFRIHDPYLYSTAGDSHLIIAVAW